MSDLPLLRKKLYFQSAHRGTKENDIMLTRFAQKYLDNMDAADMDLYNAFLNETDQDMYAWLVRGETDYPEKYADLVKNIKGCF